MTQPDVTSRQDGIPKYRIYTEYRLPWGYRLPDDFPDRLRGLKEEAELTWSGFAADIGGSARPSVPAAHCTHEDERPAAPRKPLRL